MVGLTMGLTRNATTADWIRANSAPNLWPVEGQVNRLKTIKCQMDGRAGVELLRAG